jgi:hypothetical protein
MLLDDPERVASMRRRAIASSAPRSAAAAARSVLAITTPDSRSVAFSFGTQMRPAS